MNVGIIGLGKMGLPLAALLLEKGFTVFGYRRHNMVDFITMGGISTSSCKEVAERSDIVLTCLPTDDALIEAIMGEEGLVHGASPSLIVIEISMLSIYGTATWYTLSSILFKHDAQTELPTR